MLEQLMKGAVRIEDGNVTIVDEAVIASPEMDELDRAAVFGDQDTRDNARWLIWEIGQNVGVVPSSIHDLYMARGRGETGGYIAAWSGNTALFYLRSACTRGLFRPCSAEHWKWPHRKPPPKTLE